MEDRRFGLLLLYILLHMLLCSALLYLLVESLEQTNSLISILLFVSTNILFVVLLFSNKLSLRIIWVLCAFSVLFLSLQGISDYLASLSLSYQAIQTLYGILQMRMSLVLASLFLLSSILVLQFGKYRSIEMVVLLLLGFILLTREELSSSFEDRYDLYRLFWLSVPSLSLVLFVLTLHPYLRHEASWVPINNLDTAVTNGKYGQTALRKRGRQLTSFAFLLLLLFALLWWTKISPINWNQAIRGSSAGNGLLGKNLSNQFDFGEYLQLDSSLEQDRQLVMMSQIEDFRDDRPTYLTRFTLGGLDASRSFFRDPEEPNMPGESPLPMELEQGISLFEMPRYDLRQSQEMYAFLLNIQPSSLFVLNYPTKVQTFENWPDSSFSRVYQVEARTLIQPFPFGRPLKDYADYVGAERMAYYTYVPEEYRDIGEFALQLLGRLQPAWKGSPTEPNSSGLESNSLAIQGFNIGNLQPLEIAQLFTHYFHREYRYTLNPGIAEDGDQLRYFLFNSRKGYCTYFAFSMGLMLRSLGIPSRVVVGFLLNPELRILDYYPLFADQAHAWVEVFDPEQGWVTFDPTTFELAPGEELEFGLPEGAELDLAALTEELLRNNRFNAEDGLKKLVAEKSTTELLLARFLKTFRQRSWLLPLLLLGIALVVLLLYRIRLAYFALRAPIKLQALVTLAQDKDRAENESNHKAMAKIVMAIYHLLALLNTNLFTRSDDTNASGKPRYKPLQNKLPPPQLYAWQDALQMLAQTLKQKQQLEYDQQQRTHDQSKELQTQAQISPLLHYSQLCLALFQKYYFSAEFQLEDVLCLRRYLQEIRSYLGTRKALNYWKVVRFSWYPQYLVCIVYRSLGKNGWQKQP